MLVSDKDGEAVDLVNDNVEDTEAVALRVSVGVPDAVGVADTDGVRLAVRLSVRVPDVDVVGERVSEDTVTVPEDESVGV